MTSKNVQIINHTHWDREWFLSSVYTSQWIPGLIDVLNRNVNDNPDFHYFLDGQTLIIEDLLQLAPAYQPIIEKLSQQNNLTFGPYYCQPDWQLTGGEVLIRNLLYGFQDMNRYGKPVKVGWLVDTFGHISQTPQIHRLFGIESVYVWRGVPQMEPYFEWQGTDGSSLFTVNLFGGYRNLYGVTHVPEIAIQRLQNEVAKLERFYPTADIPLFDGYDLETAPEDPLNFFQHSQTEIPPEIELCESTPQDYVALVRPKLSRLPVIAGELNSGKYGATFPGTLSTRTYLKIMSRDCDYLLYQVCEPLAVLAYLKGRSYDANRYEAWGRALLQNAVHDCICGVSIDQVHQKMEAIYRQIFDAINLEIGELLPDILRDFASGTYAVSTNPFAYHSWQVVGDQLYHLNTEGVGVWRVEKHEPLDNLTGPVQNFIWENKHFTATLREDGIVQVGQALLGKMVVSRENGDTYSDEVGLPLGVCKPVGPWRIEQKSQHHCVLSIACRAAWDEIQVTTTMHLIFDQSAMIRWQIELDSRGTNFCVNLVFETANPGQIYAGMPCDVVERQVLDQDLLPRQVDENIEKVLLGQREIGQVRTFPFHDFVAVRGERSWTTILVKGLHAYQADESGEITIPLRRAVEWLTRPDLETRLGDAGPFFYVPGARCERKVIHELAVSFTDFGLDDWRFHALASGFQNPPLLVETKGKGSQKEWLLLREDLPMNSLHLYNNQILARFFNPSSQPTALSQPRLKTDVTGRPENRVESVPAKEIVSLLVESQPSIYAHSDDRFLHLLTELAIWRVGPDKGAPDPELIQQLKDKIIRCQEQLAEIMNMLEAATGRERYTLEHQAAILEREQLEYQLSVRLNELELTHLENERSKRLFTLDPEIAAIGQQLNQARIKRRIFDYVAQILII